MMLVIYGPTQTGKTNLALQLARKFQGELISADSRQVYKGLDIGSGKVGISDVVSKHHGYWMVNGVRINGFDLTDPGQQFSAADFLEFAHTTMTQIIRAKKTPIVVGGTGFYIKALIDGISTIGYPRNEDLRQKLDRLPVDRLYRKLKRLDSKRAESMNESDQANPRRLIRAIEIALSNQKAKTTHYQLPTTNYLIIGLTVPNEYLYKKADKWLNDRIDHGLIKEIKTLLETGVDSQWLENLGLEYRWITKYLLGENSYEESLIRLKGDIHSFIRRQKTWFKKFKGIRLFDISGKNYQAPIEKTVSLWYTRENEGREESS